MERLAPLLNKDCIKILHLTTSYWKFQNDAEQKRLLDLKVRRGVSLLQQRRIAPSRATDYADFISLLGNKVTEDTYNIPKGKITRIPLSTTHTYTSPINKDFEAARKKFHMVRRVRHGTQGA